jgi:hypothetical protein
MVCVIVLGFSLGVYAPGPRSDAMVLFAWIMLALSFPSGLLVSLVLAVVLLVVDATQSLQDIQVAAWVGVPIVWMAFCAAGYIQWFVALPRLWRRLRPRARVRNDA